MFSYAFGDAFPDGRTFLDLVEGTYTAFRRAIGWTVLNNTCHCNACAHVSSLDPPFAMPIRAKPGSSAGGIKPGHDL